MMRVDFPQRLCSGDFADSISATCRPARAGCTWPRSRTWPRARSSAGRWRITCGPGCAWTRWSWPCDEVALPVARHRPVLRLRRALADQDLGRDEGLAPSTGACPRHPQRPSGAQTGGQLAAQRAATLDVERLVDGLVADPHRQV